MIVILNKLKTLNKKYLLLSAAIVLVGLFFRLYHIEFGLPHSFYADEPEISEPAIKYTYELKDIIINRNYYKLIPISFVYGTFPVYMFTTATMLFSKLNNLLGIPFDKTSIFIFLRVLNSLISLAIIPAGGFLYYMLFREKKGMILTMGLLALNWKLIVHAHYLNQDIILTLLLLLAFVFFIKYWESPKNSKYLIITAVLFGLAVGTKITALISLPPFLFLIFKKKDYIGIPAFLLLIIITFTITNPFSIILYQDFIFRVYSMLTKEAGLVFDSADSDPLKYIKALGFMVTPLVTLISAHGFFQRTKNRKDISFVLFLVCNIVFYIIFYSLQSRKVDRWLLPILPLIIIFASYGFMEIVNRKFSRIQRILVSSFVIASVFFYMYFPVLLLAQFQRYTPKSNAYLWLKENIDQSKIEPVIAITEEGLDPINKLPYSKAIKFNVYESEGAQFFIPPDTKLYKYVVISSRPMQNFKRPEVAEKYPSYSKKWYDFENELYNVEKYKLVKEFVLPKPNLIPLSDTYIFLNKEFKAN